MNYTLIIMILVLALLSAGQRVIPWIFYSRFKNSENLEDVFNLFAIAAFSALMVYNVQSLTVTTLVALVIALLFAIRFKNVGVTIVIALLVFSISTFI